MKRNQFDFDVIVVGAGPAGANCARELSQKGHKVLLVEKSQKIGEPNFSSAGTPNYLLEEFSLPENVVADFWDKFQMLTPNDQHIWYYSTPRGYVLKFNDLKQFLVKDAVDSGCQVYVGTSAIAPILENRKIIGVDFKGIQSSQVTAKIIVDASGPTGALASKVGLRQPVLSAPSIALEYIMANVKFPQKNTLAFYLGQKFAPRGYAWIFPQGETLAKIGIGICESTSFAHESLINLLKKFIKEIPWLKNAQPLELHGSSLFITGGIKNYVFENLVVIGDAGAQINPLGGEGIRHVLRASKMASKSIDLSLKKGQLSELVQYQKDWKNYVAKRWQFAYILAKIVYQKLSDENFDKALTLVRILSPEDIFDIFFEYKFSKGLKLLKGKMRQLLTKSLFNFSSMI